MSTRRISAHDPPSLQASMESALRKYLDTLDGYKPCDLHKLVIGEAERTLLKVVLDHTLGNQSKAAELLSMNRGTLRKKLRQYGIKTAGPQSQA